MSGAVHAITDIGPAVEAARRGDAKWLEEWLDAGGDPNRHDQEGWTPLLWASARGHAHAVRALLDHGGAPADPELRHAKSGALPIHFAGHSGVVDVAEAILAHDLESLNAIWDLNGHTLLLQAVFYGHLPMTRYALEGGADAAATTVRGLAAMDLARQYENREMIDLIAPFDPPQEVKDAYYRRLLERIAPATRPQERAEQELADALVDAIQTGIKGAAGDPSLVDRTLTRALELIERGADVNRLGGVLRQPALVVAVTGNNGVPPNPDVATLRKRLAQLLLQHGADPTLHEDHPMGAHAVIRASVFNHLDILKMMAEKLTPQAMADALNEIPVVNGLTALHDTVLRGSMTVPERLGGYLDQIRWAVGLGARYDIEDFSGRTQLSIAEGVADPEVRRRLVEALTT